MASGATPTARDKEFEPVAQFSIFVQNKVGRMLEIINLLAEQNVHVMACTTVDTSDSAVLRMVVDDPDTARRILHEQAIAHTETQVLVVELDGPQDVRRALSLILQAEINVHYTYAFVNRPGGKGALVFHLEDNDLAGQALRCSGFRVLAQGDISR